ncbi:MAG: response regulator transcription factor [Ignavibacteriales bacterium]|nr:response regulator transcription factor [Ignavibacteriales bacterium]
MPKTILVVDDEKDIVDLLKYNLEKERYSVLTAHTGKRALELAEKKPDLILLDIMMPEMNGMEVVKELKRNKKTESIPVLFLTAKSSETDEIVGLELGADDYIMKPISVGKILARVRTAFRRGERETKMPMSGADIIKVDDLEINVPNYSARLAHKDIAFPRKEFETLVYLVKNRGRVITREGLLNAVWGENVYVVDRTIDVHIRKIREKLGKYADYIETVKGVGYRFKAKT